MRQAATGPRDQLPPRALRPAPIPPLVQPIPAPAMGGLPENTPLPEGESGTTGENLLGATAGENLLGATAGNHLLSGTAGEDLIGTDGGQVQSELSLPPPLTVQAAPAPHTADQIQYQMVNTLHNRIERTQSAVNVFTTDYDMTRIEDDLAGIIHFVRNLPRHRALSQHELMEVCRFTSKLEKLVDVCQNLFSFSRSGQPASALDRLCYQHLNVQRRPELLSHSTPPPREGMEQLPMTGHQHQGEELPTGAGAGAGTGAGGNDNDSFLNITPYPADWDAALQWGECNGGHPRGDCNEARWGITGVGVGAPGADVGHATYTETPRPPHLAPGARRLASPPPRLSVAQPRGHNVEYRAGSGPIHSSRPPPTSTMPPPYATGHASHPPPPFPHQG